MPITKEENDRLTQIGPGTPCGELFRRYSQPVGVQTELTDEAPTKFVRILGDDLVLFRDKLGNVGLIQDHCVHRGASLLYGRVEERGIACAYHGWLYDTAGNCLETPAEPAGSLFHLTVKARTYPVRAHLGLYWTYMGPGEPPLLPNCGLSPEWGVVAVDEQIEMKCSWLQVVENFVDGLHFPILHQETGGARWVNAGDRPLSTTRGYIDYYDELKYWEEPWGIMRTTTYTTPTVTGLSVGEDDAHIFPNIRRHHHEVIIPVQIDDTNTKKYRIYPTMTPDPTRPVEHWINQFHIEVVDTPDGRHRMDKIPYQDLTVMESQGRISERETWRMATSDQGVVLLHDQLFRAMDQVEHGLDPMGVFRDPDDPALPPVLWGPSGRVRPVGIKVYPRETVSAGGA